MQNELPEWCPQWAWDEAYRIASQVVAEQGRRIGTFRPLVARALVAAERRGIARAEKVADDLYEDWRTKDSHAGLSARVIRDAIRQTAQEVK